MEKRRPHTRRQAFAAGLTRLASEKIPNRPARFFGVGLDVERFLVNLRILSKETKPPLCEPLPISAFVIGSSPTRGLFCLRRVTPVLVKSDPKVRTVISPRRHTEAIRSPVRPRQTTISPAGREQAFPRSDASPGKSAVRWNHYRAE